MNEQEIPASMKAATRAILDAEAVQSGAETATKLDVQLVLVHFAMNYFRLGMGLGIAISAAVFAGVYFWVTVIV